MDENRVCSVAEATFPLVLHLAARLADNPSRADPLVSWDEYLGPGRCVEMALDRLGEEVKALPRLTQSLAVAHGAPLEKDVAGLQAALDRILDLVAAVSAWDTPPEWDAVRLHLRRLMERPVKDVLLLLLRLQDAAREPDKKGAQLVMVCDPREEMRELEEWFLRMTSTRQGRERRGSLLGPLAAAFGLGWYCGNE